MARGNSAPKVSVRLPTYNHAPYLRACIDSVLGQTFTDFELLVVDDGSTDDTAEVLRSYTDERIRVKTLARNGGLCEAIRACMEMARGEYAALLCSDDCWEPEKLRKQVGYLDAHPEIDAVLTWVTPIGEDGEPLAEGSYTAFEATNRSREEWLHHFFFLGNCLCMPSAMVRREVYEQLDYQDVRMTALPDFDFWVRFSLSYNLYILEERLTRFRIRDNEANMSGRTIENIVRCHFEAKQILDHYLSIERAEELLRIFPEAAPYGEIEPEYLPFALGMIAVAGGEAIGVHWGLETIFHCLGNEQRRALIADRFGFRCRDFYPLVAQANLYGLRALAQNERDICSLRQERDTALDRVRALTVEWTAAAEALREMRSSTSWRVTAPLRRISGAIKKHKR